MNEVLIFGAGKIGRGFLGQLFHRSGYRLWFVDNSAELVGLLNREKKYRVDIAGSTGDTTEYIPLEGAFTTEVTPGLLDVFRRVPLLVTSVGSRNIPSTAEFIGKLLPFRDPGRPLNWLICENAIEPARKIKEILLTNQDAEADFINHKLGLVETQILRTGMTATEEILSKEPLALRMHNWWTLPLDLDAFIGEIPGVEGFRPKSNFRYELVRKIFSFNGTNGPISYIGWINGYHILHKATLAFPEFFHKIQEESSYGLIHEYGFDEKEQQEFMSLAMKKYSDPALNDPIERNARDLSRKLGKEERLAGPALLCLKHGRKPNAYAIAIAAAYCYTGSQDPGTTEVASFINDFGIEKAIQKFSGLAPGNELYAMVLRAYHEKAYYLMPEA